MKSNKNITISGYILFFLQDTLFCDHHLQYKVYYHQVYQKQDTEAAQLLNEYRQLNLNQEGF